MGKLSDTTIDMFGYPTGPETADRAPARSTDPDTSHAAARIVDKTIAVREAEVLRAYIDAGPNGLTNQELCDATGLDWNTATPRVKPLIDKQYLADLIENGKAAKRRSDVSGIPQKVRIAVRLLP